MAKTKNKFKPGTFKLKIARSKTGRGIFAQEPIPKGCLCVKCA